MSGIAIPTRNRLGLVTTSTVVNGIDFIELRKVDAKTLYVHFLNAVTVDVPGIAASISGGDRITDLKLAAIATADWSVDADGRPVLALHVDRPGDFSLYSITITDAPLDTLYAGATFSFKVLCPSDFDCEPQSDCCAPDLPPLPAIDYLAKDFESFKAALTDFSAQRYPSWAERSEADFGVMFLETLCAIADELSYLQDRVATESTLLSATQRQSLVNLARLVDYEPQSAISATTTVQCNVLGATVPAGTAVSATGPDGVSIPFEIGTGLNDTTQYAVSPGWNFGAIAPYWLDDSGRCLMCGAKGMWVEGHGLGLVTGKSGGTALLLQTDLPGESVREVVHVVAVTEAFDEIFLDAGVKRPITWITWSDAEALASEHDLAFTQIGGNLLPATQGQRYGESFAVGAAPPGSIGIPLAVVRMGPNGSDAAPNWIVRYPLSRSVEQQATMTPQARLAWLSAALGAGGGAGTAAIDADITKPAPELIVKRRLPDMQAFAFVTSLLDAAAGEPVYTVDAAAWRGVGYDANGVADGSTTQWEYDGDGGDTVRFGDGTFGDPPAYGDVFDVQYRIGLGAAGNVAADVIASFAPSSAAFLSSVRNPFAVTNGADAETAQHIQRMAPQAFQQVQYRAVRPEDYQAAADALPWVLQAGTSFRWTGSWLTVFTMADPKGNASATKKQQMGLINLLNRRRLAGYESFAPPPVYVSVDLEITVCVDPSNIASDVEAAVLARLADVDNAQGEGFFYADCFTFGTPLYRSQLETAVQGVNGVNGVLDVQYRQRGASNVFNELPDVLQVGSGRILRVANDPDYPERGTVRVFAEGGR